jgi:hypothetical protein
LCLRNDLAELLLVTKARGGNSGLAHRLNPHPRHFDEITARRVPTTHVRYFLEPIDNILHAETESVAIYARAYGPIATMWPVCRSTQYSKPEEAKPWPSAGPAGRPATSKPKLLNCKGKSSCWHEIVSPQPGQT